MLRSNHVEKLKEEAKEALELHSEKVGKSEGRG
jgi:hypothetical protein